MYLNGQQTTRPSITIPWHQQILETSNMSIVNIQNKNDIQISFTVRLMFQRHFQQYFSYIMATSFSGGGRRSTRREPPTMSKQLINCITCGCESSAPFLKYTKPGANPRRIGDILVWVVRSSDLTHWATRAPFHS